MELISPSNGIIRASSNAFSCLRRAFRDNHTLVTTALQRFCVETFDSNVSNRIRGAPLEKTIRLWFELKLVHKTQISNRFRCSHRIAFTVQFPCTYRTSSHALRIRSCTGTQFAQRIKLTFTDKFNWLYCLEQNQLLHWFECGETEKIVAYLNQIVNENKIQQTLNSLTES